MLQPGLLQPCCQEVPARKGFLDGHLFHLEMLHDGSCLLQAHQSLHREVDEEAEVEDASSL